jgi:hypothetical protein
MTEDRSTDRLARTVADLLDRVARLEERLAGPVAEPGEGRFWALEALRRAGTAGGRVVLAGTADVPDGRRYEWQEEHAAAGLVDADWGAVAGTLGALGHPVRLAVLQAVLRGRHTVRELGELEGIGTSGQAYHHLRELQAAGWIRQVRRNHHVVPGDRVVPLLVALAAAGLSADPDPEPVA